MSDVEVRENMKAKYGADVRDDIFDNRKLKEAVTRHSNAIDASSGRAKALHVRARAFGP